MLHHRSVSLAPLPIDAVLPELLQALTQARAAVLVAPTGAGKTTRVPPALLDAGLAGEGAVVVLEPRRLAARAAARRMAEERGLPLGGEVGYHVRFDRRASDATRVVVMTEGIFLRRLQDDPLLEGVGAVVFDEFHERHLDSDLALAMVRRVRQELRPELPLLVMSATLDGEAVAAALGGCPAVLSEGRSFPVELAWAPAPMQQRLPERVLLGVHDVLSRSPGDVLVFLPGLGEIRAAARALAGLVAERDLALVELYGELPADQQDAALRAGPRRKIVLATNVAETSVTIEGVTAVVDSGLARVLRFDPDSGLNRLQLEPVSRASADQRSGRAGRTEPGVCARLWTRGEHLNRPERELPELQRADLSGTVLQLLAWGEREPAELPWLEPPEPAALAVAVELLQRLGAMQDGRISARGRALARLPVAPRLGNLLLEGASLGLLREAALAAAVLSERDPVERLQRAEHVSRCDLSDRVEALLAFSARGKARAGALSLRPGAARQVLAAAKQLQALVKRSPAQGKSTTSGRSATAHLSLDQVLPRALLAGFPERVACRREPGSTRLALVGGRGARIDPASAVSEGQLLLCVALVGSGRGEPQARLVSRLERSWLDPARLNEAHEHVFEPSREAVVARRVRRYDDLLLEAAPTGELDPSACATVLAAAAAEQPERALNLGCPQLAAFRSRVASLAAWHPELELPAFDTDQLLALLPELCVGRRSFAELAAVPLASELARRLSQRQARALASLAPERLELPSGSRLRLDYDPGRAPALHVRIQELFGTLRTPCVDGGRLPVVLHLLAPNMRAEQVTDDLASFWDHIYPEVRRRLSRRYPKHAWPEDPRGARPVRRAGNRRRG
ncbi:MAG: ATP-dependent helicase HrpB [Planctomycetota bacterium]|nr:MAG: ATP-dependent helicase HrpB [Planctomycetota bacterium]